MDGQQFQSKIITMPEAVGMVQSHQTIGMGIAGSEPVGLLTELSSQRNQVEDVTLWTCLPMRAW